MVLHVYSLRKPVFNKEAKAVNVKTAMGELTILSNHRPLITLLEKGPIKVTDNNDKEHVIEATGGFIEVLPAAKLGGEVNILVD